MQINPARNGGVFYLIFKMSVGYVKSNFELQNLRWWQVILTLLNELTCMKIMLCCPKKTSKNTRFIVALLLSR
jgi:hypothetical protein